ncbi:type II toxin-antitoxin system Phd/YefM family antitoxin [Candidatus Peregrinibacteria bacterium]|nr:type II toxin-antitoxin system Phd/YefM family antitoxin [Candidatus Peregrinibacteria bacterium]
MKTIISAKDAKNKFGELLDTALGQPVTISKHGRAVVVLISQAEYERLKMFEDEYWLEHALKVKKTEYLGTEASEKFLSELMNAKN